MRRRTLSQDSETNHMMAGATVASTMDAPFPKLELPIQPPFEPMEAKIAETIPSEGGWQYEPKWDGFRCLAFRVGKEVVLQSKSGQPLGRYFPELVGALQSLKASRFVLDGEIVIMNNGRLSFDDLLMRIHPAASRILKLSKQTPCTFILFDFLVDASGGLITELALERRRLRLESFYEQYCDTPLIKLSAVTQDRAAAQRWMAELAHSGCDGVVAKEMQSPYLSGERAMRKIKSIRTADCVVGGFRFSNKGNTVGSLLLGLYDEGGLLHHVGFTSSFSRHDRAELLKVLSPHRGGAGFTGNAPGGPSRWSTERSGEWERLDPKLVVEVQYDHFSGGRFRHGTKFLRWRPEKRAQSCTIDQVTGSNQARSISPLLAA